MAVPRWPSHNTSLLSSHHFDSDVGAEHQGSAPILADDVERVLPDIDAGGPGQSQYPTPRRGLSFPLLKLMVAEPSVHITLR